MKNKPFESALFYTWYYIKYYEPPKKNSFEIPELAELFELYEMWCTDHLFSSSSWELVKKHYAKEEKQ